MECACASCYEELWGSWVRVNVVSESVCGEHATWSDVDDRSDENVSSASVYYSDWYLDAGSAHFNRARADVEGWMSGAECWVCLRIELIALDSLVYGVRMTAW